MLFSRISPTLAVENPRVIAEVGTTQITQVDLEQYITFLKSNSLLLTDTRALERSLLERLIERELLFQEMLRFKPRKPALTTALNQQDRERLLAQFIEDYVGRRLTPTDQQIKSYYDSHPKEFAVTSKPSLPNSQKKSDQLWRERVTKDSELIDVTPSFDAIRGKVLQRYMAVRSEEIVRNLIHEIRQRTKVIVYIN